MALDWLLPLVVFGTVGIEQDMNLALATEAITVPADHCLFCGTPRKGFRSQGTREKVLCPKCRSLEIHRALAAWYAGGLVAEQAKPSALLLISPHPSVVEFFGKLLPELQPVIVQDDPSQWPNLVAAGQNAAAEPGTGTESFDQVVVMGALCPENERSLLPAIFEVLKPGGSLVLATTSREHADDSFPRNPKLGGARRVKVYGELGWLRLLQPWFLVQRFSVPDPISGTRILLFRAIRDPNDSRARERFVRKIADQYAAPLSYTRAILNSQKYRYASVEECEAEPNEARRKWLINRLRGFTNAKKDYDATVAALGPREGQRTSLDIGCGLGILAQTFASNGWSAVGLDYGEGVNQMRDLVFGDAQAEFIAGDFLSYDFKGRKFDAITSVNVVEHIASPSGMIERAADLLKPGGVLYLRMPNKDCVAYVASEPHTHLLAGTLLTGDVFETYHRTALGTPPEELYNYQELDWYLAAVRAAGLEAAFHPQPEEALTAETARQQLSVLEAAIQSFSARTPPGLPTEIKDAVLRTAEVYLNRIRDQVSGPGVLDEAFQVKYLISGWRVTGTKPL